MAQLQFKDKILHLSHAQSVSVRILEPMILWLLGLQAILLGLGLQHKTVDEVQVWPPVTLSVCLSDTLHTQRELDLPASQVLGLFNRAIRKFVQVFNSVSETAVEETLPAPASRDMEPVAVGLSQELVRTCSWWSDLTLCLAD